MICAAALALLAFAAAAWPAPLLGKYQRYDAGEFVIISSRGSVQARRIMEDLAKFRVTLERMLGKHATRNTTPTTIVVTSSADWERWFKPLPGVTGYFRSGSFSNHMALDGDVSTDVTLQVVFHEFTHYYLATRFAGDYPPWFNEGLAELMGYTHFEKGVAALGIPAERLKQARDGQWIPFERLLRVDHNDPEYQSHQLMAAFYAQSWLTVYYGMIENREFGQQMFDYLTQLNLLVPQEQAARQAFGNDLSAIDRKLIEYAHTPRMSSGTYAIGEIPPVEIAAGHPLGDVEAMAILSDLLLDADKEPARVMPLIQALEQTDANKARPAALRARVAQRDNDNAAFDAAVAQAEAALAADDWLQRRELGIVLVTNGLLADRMSARSDAARAADVKRAMKLFAEAATSNKEDVESLWGFGAAAVYLGTNLELAEESLLAAYRRAPTNADIAVSLANLNGRRHDPDGMLPYLKDVARYASDLQVRRWAVEELIRSEQFIEERDAARKKK